MSIRLLSWNVNGLRSAMKKGFAAWATDCGADVIGLQETRLCEPDAPVEALSAYPNQYYNGGDRPGYAGTAILSKAEPAAVWQGFDSAFAHPDEGRVLTADCGPFFFVTAYVPNAQDELKRLDYRRQFNADFEAYLLDLERTKPVVACGDFNVAHEEIDLARPRANRGKAGFSDEERADFTRLLKAGFVDSFRHFHPGEPGHYSWWSFRGGARSRNVGWRLDYLIVSQRLLPKVTRTWIDADVMGSDHCPVGLELAL